MQITLKLHAGLTDYLPIDESGRRPRYNRLQVEVPEGSDVQSVIDLYRLPPRQVHLVLVNGVYVAPTSRGRCRLQEGDALAIWPQIAGG